ncbi:MAG: hypothetical protein ACKVHO_19175, partial [Verrucomicrobiia bacterium]
MIRSLTLAATLGNGSLTHGDDRELLKLKSSLLKEMWHHRFDLFDNGSELHLIEDVFLQIYAGSNFDQLQPGVGQAEHGSLGHEEDFPPRSAG